MPKRKKPAAHKYDMCTRQELINIILEREKVDREARNRNFQLMVQEQKGIALDFQTYRNEADEAIRKLYKIQDKNAALYLADGVIIELLNKLGCQDVAETYKGLVNR